MKKKLSLDQDDYDVSDCPGFVRPGVYCLEPITIYAGDYDEDDDDDDTIDAYEIDWENLDETDWVSVDPNQIDWRNIGTLLVVKNIPENVRGSSEIMGVEISLNIIGKLTHDLRVAAAESDSSIGPIDKMSSYASNAHDALISSTQEMLRSSSATLETVKSVKMH